MVALQGVADVRAARPPSGSRNQLHSAKFALLRRYTPAKFIKPLDGVLVIPERHKKVPLRGLFFNGGAAGTRTPDTRIMIPVDECV